MRLSVPRLRWRRRLRATGALLLLAAMLALIWTWNPEPVETVAPIRIVDGDSLIVRYDGRALAVRLRGIDAVEYRQSCSRQRVDWPCGIEARDALHQIVGRGALHCRFLAKDNYGRTLAQCRTRTAPDGVDIGAEIVRRGWAVATSDDYLAEEAAAQAQRRGVWQGDFLRPSDWRAQQASSAKAARE
ncbi:thermonuclease family protein [Sphingopyxis sp. XHP0097]|uniref:Thermonuclease family protein n=1 Tax=Sphingopyxis jiangsuensis TaxID=2871171 RepID=A0ABS7M9C1_9SPHN|nr:MULTISPECIES: thermonuclease family protein [Sphingopyxis]MBY4635618.1 thermonuclease family protein [Sphingopyxis jiangsuensis]